MSSLTFYGNGKLLLTGEYLVLDGAKALAVPTKFGQNLTVENIDEPELIWASFTHHNTCWFEANFSLPKLKLTSATFYSDKEGNSEFIAETLQKILEEAKKLNANFLNTSKGFIVKTKLSFPRNWGLGSSSTLIHNIANWAEVNPFTLLWNSFSGSGYDVACAKYNFPIVYQINEKNPKIEEVNFSPKFKNQLFFIHLNQKQNSREGISKYQKTKKEANKFLPIMNNLTEKFLRANSIKQINQIIVEHEEIIGQIIEQKPVKERLFRDYFGEVKSLGAWGGDFVLATGNTDTPNYFKKKGFNTILTYSEIIL